MSCFITQSGSFLPGDPVANDDIEKYLGHVEGEADIKRSVLRMNGIESRHYAQDQQQQPTSDVYRMACDAIEDCLTKRGSVVKPASFLSAGTTYAPLGGPGMCSLLHDQLAKRGLIDGPAEISSHAGICTSAAAAFVSATRAVAAGEHETAICVGAEHPSSALKEGAIDPVDDRDQHAELRRSQWFMTVFLRFMLSDGAGAFLLESKPKAKGVSLSVDWTESRSFAHETPLCMKLENEGVRLTQDINVLSKHLFPCVKKFATEVMHRRKEDLDNYRVVLPHLSSFFFRKKTERVLKEFSTSGNPSYWTNLKTAGNTGAASIYIMLDHFLAANELNAGDRILLFIPESGQFNFVMASLTAVVK